MNHRPRITLLTDFGTADGYVGAMKGVVAALAPGALLDDVSHDLDPGDVERACRALGRYWKRFPRGTVHLVVVDPGVGTERRALALEADGRFVVAPDNGIVTRVLDAAEGWSAVSVESRGMLSPKRSATFHGRDVFAPAAARLAADTSLSDLGPPLLDPVRLEEPEPVVEDGGILGEVVSVDRFGNLITNLTAERGRPRRVLVIAGHRLEVRATYADVEPGALVALVNSDARLEVAVRNGSAAERLGVGRGEKLRLLSI